MIEPIQTSAGNVVAFLAKGKVTGADYENVLIPAVEAALEKYDKIRLLYQLGPDFTGYEAEAVWDDTKIGMRHLTHWEKIAVVTDVDWITNSVKAFGFMMPGDVQVFSNEQLAAAQAWIVE